MQFPKIHPFCSPRRTAHLTRKRPATAKPAQLSAFRRCANAEIPPKTGDAFLAEKLSLPVSFFEKSRAYNAAIVSSQLAEIKEGRPANPKQMADLVRVALLGEANAELSPLLGDIEPALFQSRAGIAKLGTKRTAHSRSTEGASAVETGYKWLLCTQVLEALQALKKNKPAEYEQLIKVLQDTTCDLFLEVAASKNGIEHVTAENLLKNYAEVFQKARGNALLRLYIFLNLVSENPALVSRVQAETSYAPHLLFAKPNPIELRQAAEEAVALKICELITDESGTLFAKIDQFLEATSSSSAQFTINKKFVIPKSVFLKWKGDPNETEKQLSELLDSPDTKRDIYRILNRVMAWRSGHLGREINKGMPFYLSSTVFTVIHQSMNHFAMNQIFYHWLKGKPLNDLPSFAVARGYSAQEEGGDLVLTKEGVTQRVPRTLFDSSGEPPVSFHNSTHWLPLCVYVLQRFHETAKSLTVAEASATEIPRG